MTSTPHFSQDDAAVLHALVLAAVALVVLHGPEDLGAEKAVAFGLEGAVVDRLGFLDLAIRPLPDLFGGGDGYLDGFEVAAVKNIGGCTT